MAGGAGGVAQDDAEMERIAEDELAKLQRQFRIMEMERASASGGVRATLRTQRHALDTLTRELDSIMTQLKIIKSPSNLAESARARDELSTLLEQHERVAGAARRERQRAREADFLLRQVQREISTLQSEGSRAKDDFAKSVSSHTVLQQLENRLDTATKTLNSINSSNTRLREEIDNLVLDRQSFNSTWKSQLRQLAEGKAQLLELVEQAIATYDLREEWCAKLDQLKDKAASDYRKHCLEVRDLQRQLDHSLKLEEFLKTKAAVRLTATDAKAEAKRLEQLQKQQQVYDDFASLLEAIKEYTGESDVDKITQEFKRREEENFALFNYVNEVNSELRLMHDNVRNLRNSLDEERAKQDARAEQQQESVEGLQTCLQQQRLETERVQLESQRSAHTLDKLLHSVYELAVEAECESLPIIKLLGKNAKINPDNVILYLKCIEKKTLDIADVIRADEMLRRQAEAKERTPPSTRRKTNMSRTPRRSPRERVVVAPAVKLQPDKNIVLSAAP